MISSIDQSQVMLSTDRFIATRVTRDYCNAFVLLSPDIQTDQFIVIQVSMIFDIIIVQKKIHPSIITPVLQISRKGVKIMSLDNFTVILRWIFK